jgi:hypothetical protein
MKYFFMSAFIIFCLTGCGDTKPENVELTITLSFPEGVTCKSYLADHFTVTLYNSEQKKTDSTEFPCTPETDALVLYVEKDIYYFTVALKGTDDLNKSYGSGTVDLSAGDTEVKIEMAEYQGGITFKWKGSDCRDFGIHNLKFTLENDDGHVSSVIWGKEEKIENFEILCSAEMLEIVNIPAVFYTASANGFRTEESKTPRIVYSISDKFKVVSGQDQQIDINEYKEVVVSDLKISWEFDSKSIASCEDAEVTNIIASLVSDSDTISEETACDNSFDPFYFYDVSAGNYELLVRGLDSLEKTLFENSEDTQTVTVEKGLIGSDIISINILLKEK